MRRAFRLANATQMHLLILGARMFVLCFGCFAARHYIHIFAVLFVQNVFYANGARNVNGLPSEEQPRGGSEPFKM